MAEQPATSDSSPETDRDFDVTAEMMVHDYDDEQTLEEEEQNESGESFSNNELDELAQDAEIPMEHLLAMYLPPEGGNPPEDEEEEEEDEEEEEELTNGEEELTNGETEDSLPNDVYAGSRESANTRDSTQRLLRSASANADDESESGSEDSDYVPVDDWKKVISVGHDFQAVVPEGLSHYDDAPVYENEDRLLWDPYKLQAADTESFLTQVHPPPVAGMQGLKALPTGCHIRDDERTLFILLQCGHNVDEALRRHRMQMAPPADEMSLWSEEECRNFESGLRTYGKNFHLIHQHKVRTRSVGELVQFYYLWKKTARHDVFSNVGRLAKKKYHLHPGITDYMDRFLDDIDNSMSPPPAQSLLDKSRINKPPNQVTMMAHNGVPDLQNCSPAIGGLASGDLPHEASASGMLGASYSSLSYASTRPMHITSEDGVPPAKKQRLKDNDLSVLENLNNFLDSNGGMNLTNSAAELLAPIDVPPAAKPSLAHNLQNLDPSTKGLLPPQAVVAIGSGLNAKEGMSRDKYGSVVSQ